MQIFRLFMQILNEKKLKKKMLDYHYNEVKL